MASPRCFYLRLLLLCIPTVLGQIAFSQPNVINNSISKTLLSLYYQVENQLKPPASKPCIDYGVSATTEEALEKALQLNLRGQWLCAEKILQEYREAESRLAPADKLLLHLSEAEYLSSHQMYDSAQRIAETANAEADMGEMPHLKARALLVLSTICLQKRQINQSLSYADSALKISRNTADKLFEARSLLQIAFCARRNFTSVAGRSFPYYLQAKELAEGINDSAVLFTSNMYMASDNFQIAQWKEGLPYIKKAIAIALKSGNTFQSYTVYIGLAIALRQHDHIHEAMVLFRRGATVSQYLNVPYNIQHSYCQIASLYEEQRQFDSALHYVDMGMKVPGIDKYWANLWSLKAAICKASGDYKAAADMYDNAMKWANEDFLYRNQQQLSSYEATLKTNEKELQVEQEKRQSAMLKWMVIGALLILIIVIWAFVGQQRARKKLALQNNIIRQQQDALQQSLGEKDMLLKEIHHRVKNNLTVIGGLLELQSNAMDDEKAKAAMVEGQGRVRSIALIHQRLYQHENLAAIEFGGFVKEMLQQVTSVFKQPGQILTTDIKVPETLLDVDTAVPLGLILNELLTNSYKYALMPGKNGHISISLHPKDAGHFELIYKDNGPGLPEGFNLKKATSMGLRLIHRLSVQLGGSATWHFDDSCIFTIQFTDTKTRKQEV